MIKELQSLLILWTSILSCLIYFGALSTMLRSQKLPSVVANGISFSTGVHVILQVFHETANKVGTEKSLYFKNCQLFLFFNGGVIQTHGNCALKFENLNKETLKDFECTETVVLVSLPLL